MNEDRRRTPGHGIERVYDHFLLSAHMATCRRRLSYPMVSTIVYTHLCGGLLERGGLLAYACLESLLLLVHVDYQVAHLGLAARMLLHTIYHETA